MRAGWVVSFIGHVGAVMMTLLVWETRSTIAPSAGLTVPVDIVDVAPESNVRALSTDPSEEATPTPAAEEATVATPPAPTPAPAAPAPQPPRRNAAQEQNDLLAQAQNLIDRSQHQPERRSGAQGPRNQTGVGLGTAEAASLRDRAGSLVKAAMQRCWRMPADLPDPERLVVVLHFNLNRNGTLSGQPSVVSPGAYQFDPPMAQAVASALRAVRSCDFAFLPGDPLVGPHYELWQENEYRFALDQQ
jgi:hypothetical protein